MKKTLVFAVVVLCTSPAWALRFMGSPTTSGKSGLGLGFDWSHTQFDIKSDDVDGTAQLTNDIYFARLLWGVADWAEVSGMIAISDIEDNGEPSFHSGKDVNWKVAPRSSGPACHARIFEPTPQTKSLPLWKDG
ncbi:MAG: hypothetical protein U9Q07_05250, partial [Planctomycetota bacterium]|nr:hypothetical protein [Planctomycetota bacterium]